MFSFYSKDGRILTPPKELSPLLSGAYPAFFKLLGHIRFFYMVDEIWDGKSTLVFSATDEKLAVIMLYDSYFTVSVVDIELKIVDETLLPDVFKALDKTTIGRRPPEQLTANLDKYPNGIRCDLCQNNTDNNKDDFSGKRKFHVMDRNCYFGVNEGWGEAAEFSPITCDGKGHCYTNTLPCLLKNGFQNCLQCGKYHICGNCGCGHDPGECNLGITADEVTNLIIPYCEIERLDYMAQLNRT